MASAGSNLSITTSAVKIFESITDGEATTFVVACPTGSAESLEVQVSPLHKSSEWFTITAGDKEYFRCLDGAIQMVQVRAAGAGGSGAHYGIVARTGVY